MSEYKVYTVGYTGRTVPELVAMAKELDAVVVDVRYVARSRIPCFNSKALGQAFADALGPDRYVWSPGFGNINYKNGGPIALADFDAAHHALNGVMARTGLKSVILLCACKDVNTCHRKEVAERLAKEWGGTVVHLEPPGGPKDDGPSLLPKESSVYSGRSQGEGELSRPMILPSNRYHVTVIKRPERDNPFQIRIVDRLTQRVTREVIRGLTSRNRGRAYELAAAREKELNSGGAILSVVLWAEARKRAMAAIETETRHSTTAVYRQTLDRIEVYFRETFRRDIQVADEITLPIARAYLGWRKKHGRKIDDDTRASVEGVTLNKDLRHLTALWNYIESTGGASGGSNPWSAVPRLETMKRRQVRLTAPQRDALKKAAESIGVKFQACLSLSLDTGMRAMELSHVTWSHVDIGEKCLLVTREPCGWEPKDHEEGLLFFSPSTALLLRDWYNATVAQIVAQGRTGDDARNMLTETRVFGMGRSRGNDPWERTFNANLAKACAAAGVPRITSHGLRRTAARLAREAGADARDVQEMMRHSSFSTTQLYIGDDQADAARRAFAALSGAIDAKTMPRH